MTITIANPLDEFQSVRLEAYRMDLTPDEVERIRETLPAHAYAPSAIAQPRLAQPHLVNGLEGWEEL